jgi:hypothetical protein
MTGILARLAARATGRGETGGPPILAPPVRPLFAPPEPGSVDLQEEARSWQTGEAEFADTRPERPLGAPIAAPPGPADTSPGAPETLSPADIGSPSEAPAGHPTDPALGAAGRPRPLTETPTPVGAADRIGRHANVGPEERPASVRARVAGSGTPDRAGHSGQAEARTRSAILGAPPAESGAGAEARPEDAADKRSEEEAPRGRGASVAERPPEARIPELSAQPVSPASGPHPTAAVNPPADVPARSDALERPALSIGRLDVIFEAPSVPPPPRRKGAERTRGFDGFERARLGLRR